MKPSKTGPKRNFRRDQKPRPRLPEKEESRRIVGVVSRIGPNWRVTSTNRRARGEYNLYAKPTFKLESGQLVVAEKTASGRWAKDAKLVEIIGDIDSPKAVSLIAIATHEIPDVFSKDAQAEAQSAKPVGPENRVDLRPIPLVTIDGPDARDFDDAVFAEKDGEGWHLIVAIADVAHYVQPGSALDKTAYERGNSTYFPDRVVPMLPEALSNDLCSLKPHVNRACLAAHLWIDKEGELTRWQFVRGLMKSHARLTYEQVQAAVDGAPDEATKQLLDPVLKPLYGAFRCLLRARVKRGTLELDLPERKVDIKNGKIASIKIRERLDSHRLIEEFMITANVAAAAQLEGACSITDRQHAKKGACLYRIHDRPTEMKLDGLRDFLDTLGISLVPKAQLHPRFLTQILENAAGTPHAQVVNEMILRSQSQAVYSPENIGHFGLALAKYAHFTSPIRRYADLVVHRGLIRACGLGEGGLTDRDVDSLEEIADHISVAERRSVAAERDALDRFVTLFMADRVGETFPAKISGISRFGLFARLEETGADGIIPLRTLPDDYYVHNEKRQALVGRRTKKAYRLGQTLTVQLAMADRITGSLALTLVEEKRKQPAPFKGKKATDSAKKEPAPPRSEKRSERNRQKRKFKKNKDKAART